MGQQRWNCPVAGAPSRIRASDRHPMNSDVVDASWASDAACIGIDPDDYRAIFLLCRECPVYTDCLQWSVKWDATHKDVLEGIWGGLPADVRELMRTYLMEWCPSCHRWVDAFENWDATLNICLACKIERQR